MIESLDSLGRQASNTVSPVLERLLEQTHKRESSPVLMVVRVSTSLEYVTSIFQTQRECANFPKRIDTRTPQAPIAETSI